MERTWAVKSAISDGCLRLGHWNLRVVRGGLSPANVRRERHCAFCPSLWCLDFFGAEHLRSDHPAETRPEKVQRTYVHDRSVA